MAKIVITGLADCPFYAIAENICDHLQKNLNDFYVTKFPKLSTEWSEWLTNICSTNNWDHTHSPLIWRELVNVGGKALIIGGINEFQEYAYEYYNAICSIPTSKLMLISEENLQWKLEAVKKERFEKEKICPKVITIIEAGIEESIFFITELLASKICVAQDIQLNVYIDEFEDDNFDKIKSLEDIGFDSLRSIKIFSKLPDSLIGSDLVLFIKSYNQTESELAKYYSQCCKNKCKVSTKYVFCGINGDVNYFAQHFNCAGFPCSNIMTISGNIDTQARNKIADKIDVIVADVVDLVGWGNFNNSYHMSYKFCKVLNSNGAIQKSSSVYYRPLKEILYNEKWIETLFESIEKSSVRQNINLLAHVNKVINILEQWLCAGDGNMYSIGISSQNWYGIPCGIFFNCPVIFSKNGGWSVVEDLTLENNDKMNIFECLKNQTQIYDNFVSESDKSRIEKFMADSEEAKEIEILDEES